VPTPEDRIAALEREVAMLELLRSRDERKAEGGIPPCTGAQYEGDQRKYNHSTWGHFQPGRGDQGNKRGCISSSKDRLDRLETQSNKHTALLNVHTGRFDHVEALLTQILARLPEKT
jgi:hypothetical protein